MLSVNNNASIYGQTHHDPSLD